MAKTEQIARAASLVTRAFEDDELLGQLQQAVKAGRGAVVQRRLGRNPPPQTRLDRAGASVRAAGGALRSARQLEPEPESRGVGRTVVAVLAMGGMVAALSARRSTAVKSTEGGIG